MQIVPSLQKKYCLHVCHITDIMHPNKLDTRSPNYLFMPPRFNENPQIFKVPFIPPTFSQLRATTYLNLTIIIKDKPLNKFHSYEKQNVRRHAIWFLQFSL